ncbi:MAG: FAD:protein FMN transferase [Clostridia bacterium]|nr:FAD:protein FMN transferase [Clostridia bacterium]
MYTPVGRDFSAASVAVHAELVRLDGIFDMYDEKSVLYQLNETGEVAYDPDLAAVLELASDFYEKTGGKLDVTLGRVFLIWHEFREGEGGLPEYGELLEASAGAGSECYFIENDRIKLKEGVKLDLGAVAKGYAAKKAAEAAEEIVSRNAFGNFILNVGGSVTAYGKKGDGSDWKVGIENPEGGIFTTLSVSGISVVTSGDYQRYRDLDGKRYHHIIDPDTFMPADRFRSVTVIHSDPFVADALSTSLFCMSKEDGEALALRYGAEILWIYSDMTAARTPGFYKYEK